MRTRPPATRRRPRRAAALLLVLLLALTGGCLAVPTDGPVRDVDARADPSPEAGFAYEPRPPQPGASRVETVEGFLEAMEATPISTAIAREYLADGYAEEWDASGRTVVYAERRTRADGRIHVDLTDAQWIDGRGQWQGPLGPRRSGLRFTLVREGSEWRISSAPEALVVSRTWFESRYDRASLYFFEPSGRVLVPEPVFVPSDGQLATTLVRSLLLGPGRRGVVRSFLPGGVGASADVEVDDGIARIDLTAGGDDPVSARQQLMVAQLAWTLRQDSAVQAFRLSVNGQTVRGPDGEEIIATTVGSRYDPVGSAANRAIYGLREGAVVAGEDGELRRVGGVWSELGEVAAVAPDVAATNAAVLTSSRQRVLIGELGPGGVLKETPLTGTDLLPPVWDALDRLWAVDRTASGARVRYFSDGKVDTVSVPGITGADVRDVLVSRDGTRLIALVEDRGTDRILISRLRSDGRGRITGATPAHDLVRGESGSERIDEIAWQSPTTVASMRRVGGTAVLEVRSVDGTRTDYLPSAVAGSDQIDQLVGTPVGGEPLYARSGSVLIDLTESGEDLTLPDGVSRVTYAG